MPAVTMVTASEVKEAGKRSALRASAGVQACCGGGCPHKISCVTTGRYSGQDGGCVQSYEASIKVTSHYLLSKWSFGSVTTILESYM